MSMGLGLRLGLGLGGGRGRGPAPNPDIARYQLLGSRFYPGNRSAALVAADKYMINRKVMFLPTAVTNFRMAFIGWYLVVNASQEFNVGSSQTIEGIRYSTNQGASYQTITINGSGSAVIADAEAGLWTDPVNLPAGEVWLDIASYSPTQRGYCGGIAHRLGEKALWSSTSLAGLLGTNFTDGLQSASGETNVFGPALAIGQMGDTAAAVLVLGTSLEMGFSQGDNSADDRGNVAYTGMGLDDTSGGRMTYVRWAIQSSLINQMDATRLTKRKALLNSAKAFNINGQEVFDSVIVGQSFNDNYSPAGYTYSLSTEYSLAFPERVAAITAAVSNVRALWPTAKVILCTTPAQMNDTLATNRYTDMTQCTIAAAVASSPNATLFRTDLRAAIIANTPGQDFTIDLEGAVQDLSGAGKFVMTGAYSGTLVGATAINATSFVVTGSPPVDSILIPDPGNAANDIFLAAQVVDNGDGTSTISNPHSTTRNTLPHAHTAGAAVKEARTTDGIHYRRVMAGIAAQAVITVKLAGGFRA